MKRPSTEKQLPALLKELAASPKDVRLLQRVGEAYQKLADNRRAAEYFGRVAECYAQDGYFLKAVALSKQVLKLNPEAAGERERLLSLYLQLGLQDGAAAIQRELRERATTEEDVRRIDELVAKLQKLVDQ